MHVVPWVGLLLFEVGFDVGLEVGLEVGFDVGFEVGLEVGLPVGVLEVGVGLVPVWICVKASAMLAPL